MEGDHFNKSNGSEVKMTNLLKKLFVQKKIVIYIAVTLKKWSIVFGYA
jgi:hypothetical protein